MVLESGFAGAGERGIAARAARTYARENVLLSERRGDISQMDGVTIAKGHTKETKP